MYNKILVPLDGSSFSECILDHVKAVATGCKVPEVILLSVVEPVEAQLHTFYVPSDWPSQVKEADDKAMAEAREYLAKVAQRLEKDGVTAKPVVLFAREIDEEILRYAAENKIDLIIMSTHGSSGVRRWHFGSVARRVATHSPVPLLMASPPGCRLYR